MQFYTCTALTLCGALIIKTHLFFLRYECFSGERRDDKEGKEHVACATKEVGCEIFHSLALDSNTFSVGSGRLGVERFVTDVFGVRTFR